MANVFDRAVEAGLAGLREIPSPFEVARKLGLNIPTGEDIEDILSIIGPQADIKAMVEESAKVVPAFKKGDYSEAISSLGLAALAPFMIGIPGTVSGIRKGSQEFVDVVEIPYRRRTIFLRFEADGKGNFGVSSWSDKHLLHRADQARYDDRIFKSEEEFIKFYNRSKKKEIKEPSSQPEGLASLGEPSSVEQAVQKNVKNYKAKKINPGQYKYRGYEIYNPATDDIDDYTHWNITPPGETSPTDATNTLWQAKELIDRYLVDLGEK